MASLDRMDAVVPNKNMSTTLGSSTPTTSNMGRTRKWLFQLKGIPPSLSISVAHPSLPAFSVIDKLHEGVKMNKHLPIAAFLFIHEHPECLVGFPDKPSSAFLVGSNSINQRGFQRAFLVPSHPTGQFFSKNSLGFAEKVNRGDVDPNRALDRGPRQYCCQLWGRDRFRNQYPQEDGMKSFHYWLYEISIIAPPPIIIRVTRLGRISTIGDLNACYK